MRNKLLIAVAVLLSIYLAAGVNYPVAELGNCASEEACAVYCDNPDNIESCINFAEENGMMTQQEAEEARKVLPFIKNGQTPGNCRNQKECDEYCDSEENLDECIDFALRAGLIDSEDAEMAKKTRGRGPGGCKREECKGYCEKEENFQTCIDFALENGMMSQEEYEMAKKTGGKGPGDCKGKEECDAYCREHELECMKFGVDHGLAPEMNEESKCMMECMVRANVVCKPGPDQNSECKQCSEECSKYYNGPCLFGSKYEEKVKECHDNNMAPKDVMGDSGQEGRGECPIDIECIPYEEGEDMTPRTDSSREYDESKGGPRPEEGEKSCEDCASKCSPPEGQMVDRTDCINDQCECFYKDIELPPEDEFQGDESGGGDGGCTEPGPEGQCGPSGSSDETSIDSGDQGITGQIVSEQKGQGLLERILKFLFKA